MKAGYLALFAMVLAYSGYQGGGTSNNVSSQTTSRTSGSSEKTMKAVPPPKSKGGQPLPTIGGGMCQLTINEDSNGPCGGCTAICPAVGLTELIQGYFRAQTPSDPKSLKYLSKHWYVPQAEQSKIKFVIASLPDPVHTHMALQFDRSIETIQSSAQANGYLFSRAWMPWDISTPQRIY